MADVNKIKLPDNSTVNIKDYRIPGVDSTPTSGSSNVVTSGGIHTAIADTELVVATALNDLNDRVSDLEDGAETLESDSVWEAGTGTNSVIIKGSLGTAGGNYSTVEGKGCISGGTHSTYDLTPDTADNTAGSYAHAEGRYTIACGKKGSHAEGDRTLASGAQSHAEGVLTVASGQYSHAEGGRTAATDGAAHAEGYNTIASGTFSHVEGEGSMATSARSHAEGYCSKTIGSISHAEGVASVAIGSGSHSESLSCAYGAKSHAETGNKGVDIFPVGAANATSYTSTWDTEFDSIRNAVGDTVFCNILKASFIITKSLTVSMEPVRITDASLSGSTLSLTTEKTLSETALDGSVNYWICFSIAYGDTSHTECSGNIAYGEDSHAEGGYNVAQGRASHAEGWFTFTNNVSEHAEGSYNLSTKTSTTYGNAGNTQHSIGIGTASARKNAVEVMQNGDTYLYGIGTYDGTNYSSATTIQDVINGKQEALVSGTNLKTINNESLLGSGNITISGGGVVPDLGNAKIFYGTCDTAASTTKKEVVCSAFTSADFVAGALIFVKFSKTNSGAVASLTMDVNSTGEVRLKKMYKNTAPSDLAAVAELQADVTYLFTYTGSAWVCMTLDYNTTYSGMTDAEVTAGTGTTNRLITPARLKSAINTWAPNNVFLATYGTTTYAEVKAAYDAGKWVFCKRELNPDLYIIPLSFIDPSSGSEQANFSITAGSNELSLAILDGTDDSWTFNTYVCGNVKGVKMNGTTYNPGNSGVVDLGTVITSHQDISGKQDTIVSNSVITGVSSGGIRAIKGTDNKLYALSTLLTSPGDDYTLARLNDIPTVNNSTITIQKGGSTVDTFTTNASSDKSINIPNELPSYSSSDSGKILSVNSSGNLVWLTPAAIRSGSGTPSNSTGNNGDIYLQTS